jgi:hypothetical protein
MESLQIMETSATITTVEELRFLSAPPLRRYGISCAAEGLRNSPIRFSHPQRRQHADQAVSRKHHPVLVVIQGLSPSTFIVEPRQIPAAKKIIIRLSRVQLLA